MVNVPDPAPDMWRVPRQVTPTLGLDADREEIPYDEYRRDGITNAGLIRYVRVVT
jgi:hypothetical protein